MTLSTENAQTPRQVLFHSARLTREASGILLSLTREQAAWDTIDFSVRRLAKGDAWSGNTGADEAAFVILGGRVEIDFGRGLQLLGKRENVFAGYPHAVYLPPGSSFKVTPLTACELADCRVPSTTSHEPQVIMPDQLRTEIRGGGNATRQIIDIVSPVFAADKLLICEVFTPSGNWSSYPPHKHDVHNPPEEVDLDETYYYRIDPPHGYALQRLYGASDGRDQTLMVLDGDLVTIHGGYHPVVAAYGFKSYYLNVLAGSARSMAASDDPAFAYLRHAWPPPDSRLPVVQK